MLKTADTFYQWDHYPPGDVYDPETHAQYYYHAHDPDAREMAEHGHFHTFMRPKGMPEGVRPLPLPAPEPVEAEGDNDALSHLVCISMNRDGLPLRLFTTNRWVTGETWYAAGDVVRMLDRFEIDVAYPSWATNRWLSGMVVLFRPQIAELLRQRDRAVEDWQSRHPGVDAYEDRGLEITSQANISIEAQIAAVEAALAARG